MNIPGTINLYKGVNGRFFDYPTEYWRSLTIFVLLLTPGLLGDAAACSIASLPLFFAQMVPQLYYMAIVFAAAHFGIVGGLASACIAGASHLTILGTLCGGPISQSGHLFMFAAVGLTAGWLSEKIPAVAATRKHVNTAVEDRSTNIPLSQLGRLMPDLVHQFRTPIASIEGASFVLQDSDLSGDKRQEFVGIIRKECRHLELLVKLLDFTQSGSSEYRELDVARLLDEVIALCRTDVDGQVTFRNTARMDTPRLRCEPELIKHAVHVLTTISIDVASQNGRVELSTDFSPQEIVIIFNARAEHLRPRFSNVMQFNRNAIDFAVVQHIVSRHGGSIREEQAAGAGLSIFMALPRDSWMHV